MKLRINVIDYRPTERNRVTLKNSLDRTLYIGGSDVTVRNGFVILPGQERAMIVHEGQQLWMCTARDERQFLCTIRRR